MRYRWAIHKSVFYFMRTCVRNYIKIVSFLPVAIAELLIICYNAIDLSLFDR